MKILGAIGAFAGLDFGCGLRQLFPCLRNPQAVFLQQVGAVIQHACIGVPRHAHQFAVDRVVGNYGWKVLGFHAFAVGLEINQVIFQQARPHGVNLHHIDVARFGGKQLAVQR